MPAEPLQAAQRNRLQEQFGRNLSAVRVHRDAAASRAAASLGAAAVTLGRHVFLGRDFGAPLLAHEVAHTLQSGDANADPSVASSLSTPGDALEVNAVALASGATREVRRAPPGLVLRAPLPGESDDERVRRETLLRAIALALDQVLLLLRSGGLLRRTEVAVTRNGVRGIVYGTHAAGTEADEFTSYADRDARLRRIAMTLMAMGTQYRVTPIPPGFTPPRRDETGGFGSEVEHPPGGEYTSSIFSGSSAMWADLQAAYARYRDAQGQTGAAYFNDWYYIDPRESVVPGAASGAPRIDRGTPSGAYMVFPDIDREPLRYWHLDGFRPAPRGSVIIEFWHDDFGYYYEHGGMRIDVPNPWRNKARRTTQ